MSMAEQVETFSNARVVVGVHGAALANVAFRKHAELDIIEILPSIDACDFSHYMLLAHTLNFRYQAAQAIVVRKEAGAVSLTVDATQFETTLRSVIAGL
jgi:capsular polysaccharide biosynthesis protein